MGVQGVDDFETRHTTSGFQGIVELHVDHLDLVNGHFIRRVDPAMLTLYLIQYVVGLGGSLDA